MTTADRILAFIIEFKYANQGLAPSRREIMAGADVSSTSMVNYNLALLEEQNKVVLGNKNRQIWVVGGEWRWNGNQSGG